MVTLIKNTKHLIPYLLLLLIFTTQISYAQTKSCDEIDKELSGLYDKIFPFYYGNNDSLVYYSELFTAQITKYLKENPSTIFCNFDALNRKRGFSTGETKDGLFKMYSWDTWTGGTMRMYKNLYQFQTDGKIYTSVIDYGDKDIGTFFNDIYTVKTGEKNYFLATSSGTESSTIYYESIRILCTEGDKITDTVSLIKTPKGLSNYISIEYTSWGAKKLIKYDEAKKTIYIPIILKDGKITNRFILYKFTGQYFEKVAAQKETNKKKTKKK